MAESFELVLTCNKVIFSDPKFIPAEGSYPAKYQVEVKANTVSFFMQSRVLNFENVPVLEPCKLTATVSRLGGGKNYHILEVSSFSAEPVISQGARVTQK